MQFEPKTEKQIEEETLQAGREYDATVTEATDTKSKKGNPMIELTLSVYVGTRTVPMKDWLVPAMPLKLLQFCDSAGVRDIYDGGNLVANDCFNRDVRVQVGSRRDPSGQYPDQKVINGYVSRPKNAPPLKKEGAFAAADIPF